MIRKLELIGWKSHEKTVFEFSEGSNVFFGIMGSGKSSILQGVTFALFGDVPEVRTRKISLSDLIMRKPRKLEKARVKLVFTFDDLIYTVERAITKKGGEAKLYKEGKIFEIGSKRVTEKICEILGTDYETFVNVVYARQNEIDNFLRYGKGERVKLIDNLLKIDRLEEARKGLRSFQTGITGKLTGLNQISKRDISEQVDMLEFSDKKIENLTNELTDIQAIISTTKERINAKKLKFNKLDEKRNERNEIIQKMSVIEGEEKNLFSMISELPDISMASEKQLGEEERLKRLKANENQINSDLATKRGRKKHIEERLNEIRKYEKLSKEKVIDYSNELKEKRESLMKLSTELDSRQKAIIQLKNAGAKCPVCGSDLKNPEEHIKLHKRLVKKLTSKIEGLVKKVEILEIQVRKNEKKKIEIENAKRFVKDLPELENEFKKIDLKVLEQKFKKIKIEREAQEKVVDDLKQAVRREEFQKRLIQLGKQREEYGLKLKSVGFDEAVYKQIREDIQEMTKEYVTNLARMKVIPKIIEAKQNESSALRREIKEVNLAKQEAEKIEKGLENLSLLINSITDVQVLVRQQFVEIVNELLSEIWASLYPYGDYSSLRLFVEKEGRRTGDYILQLREHEGWVNVDGVASGGEKSIASLALRVAFSRALSKLGMLFLDEPTHDLDDNGIEKLTDVLREGITNVLNQVVIITHEERMEKAATGAVYKLARNKEKEEVTKAERL